jgi:hypothetical protein
MLRALALVGCGGDPAPGPAERDGDALPPVPSGNRGDHVLGPARLTVPGTGRSRVQLYGFQREAPETLTWMCYASAGCGSTEYNSVFLWLWGSLLLADP